MPKAISVSGQAALRRRFSAVRQSVNEEMARGVYEAIVFLEGKAKEILDAEIYNAPRPPFAPALDKEAAGSLYQSFTREFNLLAQSVYQGLLGNTSPHALFLEVGTDDEGTGDHWVGPAAAQALHFVDPQSGGEFFSKGHFVRGIHPIHFMERALRENKEAVLIIFEKRLRAALNQFGKR